MWGEDRFPERIMSSDITNKETPRTTEETLKDVEERFKLFLEHSPVYVFFKDERLRAVQLSRNYESMLGRPLAELLGKSMDELFPSPLAQRMMEDDRRIMQQGKPIEVEEELGGRVYATLKFPVVKDGTARFLAGFTMDITERKLAEESLRLDEARLGTLLELSQMQGRDEKEILAFALEAGVTLTQSAGGYLHFYNDAEQTISLCTWSSRALSQCQTQQDQHYPLVSAGIWADSIRKRRAVIHNDYSTEPGKRGYPEGHFHLRRHLGVPVFDGDRIVVAAGVGNKAKPYNDSDVRQLSLLLNSMWGIVKQKRTEQERERLIQELQDALGKIKTLSGMLPICASCKRIRNDRGTWEPMETYIRDRSGAEFTHGVCPSCANALYGHLSRGTDDDAPRG